MKEMQRRHNEVLTYRRRVPCAEMAYHDWLANMMSGIADEHKDLERIKLAQAKASRDPARLLISNRGRNPHEKRLLCATIEKSTLRQNLRWPGFKTRRHGRR